MKKTTIYFIALIALSTVSLSCAKKPSGVRTIKQTQGYAINQQQNNTSMNQANNQNQLYNVVSVELPEAGSQPEVVSVTSEIKTPYGQYLPITTTHTGGKDVYGVLTDSMNGTQLDIRSRCLGASCEKYFLLVTVVKNNYAIHQIVVVSNSNQNFFRFQHINYTVGSFFQSLDAVQAAYQSL